MRESSHHHTASSAMASAGSSMDIVIAAQAPPPSKYIFEGGVLKLGGEDVKIYHFDDAPEMPWFQAKPIHNFLGFASTITTKVR